MQLAHMLNGEILSGDSRQVYRGMDIGTGKDLEEYYYQGQHIPHHLIDIVEAGDSYHIYQFQQDFQKAYNQIIFKQKTPILCGGSGLYLEAVLKGFEYTSIPVDQLLRNELVKVSDENLLELFKQNNTKYSSLADTSTRKRLVTSHRNKHISKSKP